MTIIWLIHRNTRGAQTHGAGSSRPSQDIDSDLNERRH
jgi:hypothetical protein